MAYMMLETSVRTHKKFLAAGPEACWLWVCGLGYCQDGLTDGFIPDSAIEYLGVKRARTLAKKLLAVRLWEVTDGGWRMHDYLQHNKPAEEIREIMRRRKEGGRLGGRPPKTSEDNLQGFDLVPAQPNLTGNPVHDSTSSTSETSEGTESLEVNPPVLVFPTVGKGQREWPLTETQVAEWTELFPSVDVLAEAKKALAWIKANPGRTKTARGMAKFLVGWLTRSNDRGGSTPGGGQGERPYTERELKAYWDWIRAVGGCHHRAECGTRQECMAKFIKGRLRGEPIAS